MKPIPEGPKDRLEAVFNEKDISEELDKLADIYLEMPRRIEAALQDSLFLASQCNGVEVAGVQILHDKATPGTIYCLWPFGSRPGQVADLEIYNHPKAPSEYFILHRFYTYDDFGNKTKQTREEFRVHMEVDVPLASTITYRQPQMPGDRGSERLSAEQSWVVLHNLLGLNEIDNDSHLG